MVDAHRLDSLDLAPVGVGVDRFDELVFGGLVGAVH
eukprot:SAG11_NODE_3927_length_2144_cov_13.208802_5_plen_36_part_00